MHSIGKNPSHVERIMVRCVHALMRQRCAEDLESMVHWCNGSVARHRPGPLSRVVQRFAADLNFEPKPEGAMNRYGSEGPAQLYIPGGLLLLPPTTAIRLCTGLSGEPVDSGETGLPTNVVINMAADAESLTMEWLHAFVTKVGVPADCISFIWEREGPMKFLVTILFKPLDPKVRYSRTKGNTDLCDVCTLPCIVADNEMDTELNCSECGPSNLCGRCKIELFFGYFKCFICLTDGPDEWSSVKEDQHPAVRFRMTLLEQWGDD